MSEVAKWDIWHVRFAYEEKHGYKYRPAIVVAVSEDGSQVMMVSDANNKLQLEGDYLIKDWQEAGLDKPSIARVQRVVEIPPSYIGKGGKFGHLSERDARNIEILLKQYSNPDK